VRALELVVMIAVALTPGDDRGRGGTKSALARASIEWVPQSGTRSRWLERASSSYRNPEPSPCWLERASSSCRHPENASAHFPSTLPRARGGALEITFAATCAHELATAAGVRVVRRGRRLVGGSATRVDRRRARRRRAERSSASCSARVAADSPCERRSTMRARADFYRAQLVVYEGTPQACRPTFRVRSTEAPLRETLTRSIAGIATSTSSHATITVHRARRAGIGRSSCCRRSTSDFPILSPWRG
jgi:hypothetical protein